MIDNRVGKEDAMLWRVIELSVRKEDLLPFFI